MKTSFQSCWTQRLSSLLLILGSLGLLGGLLGTDLRADSLPVLSPQESRFLQAPRTLSTGKLRAGEYYLSADGTLASFQAELPGDNPFYQIFVQDVRTGQETQVSTGVGRTSCSWIHPSNTLVLFSSTHHDPLALQKQKQEIERRKLNLPKQYAWDFDPEFEIYSYDLIRKTFQPLAPAPGYDAEASYSPDGSKIVFASNRHAYTEELTDAEKKLLIEQPSQFLELYVMNADGSNVKRLTHTWGYDGGPFFSPDGREVIFRRFGPDGRNSEIFALTLDTLKERQLTQMGAMAWAPFYHPTGDYYVFAVAGLGGEHAFELYLADTQSKHAPVRVTYDRGFDGLPVFTPDGKTLIWSSTRADGSTAQLVAATWDDSEARSALGLATPLKSLASEPLSAQVSAQALEAAVRAFAAPEQEGRLSGSPGELRSVLWVESFFKQLKLIPVPERPSGDRVKPLESVVPLEATQGPGSGSYLNSFSFGLGTSLGSPNQLMIRTSGAPSATAELRTDFLPLGFSRSGSVPASPIVFAGYGIESPAQDGLPAYSSYAGLGPDSLSGKWVAVLRYEPENVEPKLRQLLIQHSSLSEKLAVARAKGALGILVLSLESSSAGPEKLIPLSHSTSSSSSGFGLSIRSRLLALPEATLSDLKRRLDLGEAIRPFEVPNQTLEAEIRINRTLAQGHNLLGMLTPEDTSDSTLHSQPLILGAHLDHLGHGETHTSRATAAEVGQAHLGADDNASGSALVLEVARVLATHPTLRSKLKRPVIFALWSGEEFGTLGSLNWLKSQPVPAGFAYVNADMVGRLREQLVVQGIGSSNSWEPRVRNLLKSTSPDLPVSFQSDPYLPTDSMPFYQAKTPTLNFFTGSHDEYHTPRDRPETINFVGLEKITALALALATELATTSEEIPYVEVPPSLKPGKRFKVFLGTLPDYSYDPSAPGNLAGMKITGVQNQSPAQKAGLQGGDILTKICGYDLSNLDDYMFALGILTPLKTCPLSWFRGEISMQGEITPLPRDAH